MDEQQSVDRRVRRTRRELREALFALIVERGYEDIAVLDITERANLGRTTFYLHYHEKDELLVEGLRELINELRQGVEPEMGEICTYYTRSIRIFQHVARHRALYQALLGEMGPPGSIPLLRKYFAELYQRRVLEPLSVGEVSSASRFDLLAAHAAGSLLGLIECWLKQGLSPTSEEMGDLYWRLMSPGTNNVLGRDKESPSLEYPLHPKRGVIPDKK
jgi:AcrR family transcriptional regulator